MKGGKIMMTGSYDVESWLLLEGLAVDLRTHICRILNENLFNLLKEKTNILDFSIGSQENTRIRFSPR